MRMARQELSGSAVLVPPRLGGSPCQPLLPHGGAQPHPSCVTRLLSWGSNRRTWACYLHAVFTFEALAAVVGHLVADEVGLPVEGLGTLVTLVLSLLCVDDHVLLQAVQWGQGSLQGPSAHRLPRNGDPQPSMACCLQPVRAPPPPHSLLREQSESHYPLDRSRGWRRREGLPGVSLGPCPRQMPRESPAHTSYGSSGQS